MRPDYVPDWFKLDDYETYEIAIEVRMDALTEARMSCIKNDEMSADEICKVMKSLDGEIAAVRRAAEEMIGWVAVLEAREARQAERVEESRRLASVPEAYILPGGMERGVRVAGVEDMIVGEGVTVGDLRDALSGLVLRDETGADDVHVAMPTTAWAIISAFIRGVE